MSRKDEMAAHMVSPSVLLGLFCLLTLPAGVVGQEYTAGPGLAIVPIDDGYDGTLDPNSMASSTIPVPSDGTDLIREVSVELTMSTLFLGEFIIKLKSPTGTVVTLMHRAGLAGIPDDGTDSVVANFGDGSNLSFQYPITFADDAASGIGAELMGAAPVDIGRDGVVGDPNDPKGATPDNYIPDAGDLSTLNGGPLVDKFSAFDGETTVGDWVLYLGDGAPGGPPYVLDLDQWTLQLITYAPGDFDGDGVPDGSDACPDTAPGDPVDPNGCSTADDDTDGVLNDQDLCPGTPACATDIDADGCAVDSDADTVPDGCDICEGFDDTVDSDGDGIPDGCDACPDTAPGDPVDPNGCSTADDDTDGVLNDQDLCPGTPACASNVDADGCAADSDGDGVPDGCDTCPNTASGDPVDPNGCSTADDDGDGVLNDQDLCPGTPACATDIDADGCPADSDADGVPDGCDLCPGTASGEPVDSDGCSTADDDDDGVLNDQDLCPDTPACATDIDADGCAIDSDGDDVPDGCDICEGFDDAVDSDGDGVPDGCDTPPSQDTPDGCCGAAGPVSPIGLAVGMLLLSRFGGYRTRSRRRG